MGTKMGPSYACLFIGYLEHHNNILGSHDGPVPELYRRYIDDGLGATSLSEQELLKFISYCSIQFTHKISPSSVEFLDISISLVDGLFSTCLFYKATDSHF
ncbi:MAG: hypothetical protein MJA29_00895, partial [Candidatus Omnitrophica bacterium]|nr:hypothetical protein [Candidatus Omnitrophota bacterium]